MSSKGVNNFVWEYGDMEFDRKLKKIEKIKGNVYDLENTNEQQNIFVKNNLSLRDKKYYPWDMENQLLNVKKISNGYENLRQTFDVKRSRKFVYVRP